jgi:hypothetical protein
MKPEDIVALLTVMDLAKQWPQLQAIHDNAMATLLEVNAEAKTEIADRAAAKAEADAKAKAKAEAKVKADADAQAAADTAARPRAIPSSAVTEADRRL